VDETFPHTLRDYYLYPVNTRRLLGGAVVQRLGAGEFQQLFSGQPSIVGFVNPKFSATTSVGSDLPSVLAGDRNFHDEHAFENDKIWLLRL
jgi:hypothetical protein